MRLFILTLKPPWQQVFRLWITLLDKMVRAAIMGATIEKLNRSKGDWATALSS
jgi:hypothetical protein